MGFGLQLLGLGMSGIGMMQQNKRAKEAQRLQEYMFREQMDLQRANFGLAQDAFRQNTEENAYRRQIEQLNRLMAQEERQYQINELEKNKQILLEERRAVIERQIKEDKEAAKLAAFRMERLLKNEALSEQERAFAIQELREAQRIAQGEADEDKRRFLEAQELKKIERDFQMQEYQEAKALAEGEKAEQMAFRDRIMNNIDGLRTALSETASNLGDVPEIQRITQGDINAETDRRTKAYQSDIDRAAEAVASVNEADLMRGGIDRSSTATDARGEIARRIADEYQGARMRAGDDALSYITGQNQALNANLEAILGRRGAILDETARIGGVGIDQMMNMQNMPSSLGVYNMATSAPSAVYDRTGLSAGNYQSPVNIGSAIYGGMNPISSIAQYRNLPSMVNNAGMNVKSAATGPIAINVPNASTYMSNANNIGQNLLTGATSSYNNALTSLANASSGFGMDLQKLGADSYYRQDEGGNYFGKRFDDYIYSGMDKAGQFLGGLFNRG
tara:strand:+ start:15164 stop:16681 length:1518 start_codon:yes stop_codon:yes gene_type:complete